MVTTTYYYIFRINFRDELVKLNCLTHDLNNALFSKNDGDLAIAIGNYAMEPFIHNMSSIELLEVFAPDLLKTLTKEKLYIHPYTSLNDLLDDIDFYNNHP